MAIVLAVLVTMRPLATQGEAKLVEYNVVKWFSYLRFFIEYFGVATLVKFSNSFSHVEILQIVDLDTTDKQTPGTSPISNIIIDDHNAIFVVSEITPYNIDIHRASTCLVSASLENMEPNSINKIVFP